MRAVVVSFAQWSEDSGQVVVLRGGEKMRKPSHVGEACET